MVFEDANGNGTRDEDEAGVLGVEVNAAGAAQANASAPNLTATTVTDVDGRYRFDNLPPADYQLTFAPPSGYQGDGIGEVMVTVQAGEVANAPSVGMQRNESKIYLPNMRRP
jgi:protocatechuate 3,4-dioxygenase beta subunit